MIEHLCGGRRRRLRHREPEGRLLPIYGAPWEPARRPRRHPYWAVLVAVVVVALSWALFLLVVGIAFGVIG